MNIFGCCPNINIFSFPVIFKVYDSDCNGKVSFNDILEVLRDMSGSFMSDEQREVKPKFNQFLFSVCVIIEGQGLMIWIEILVIGVHWVMYSCYQPVNHELHSIMI